MTCCGHSRNRVPSVEIHGKSQVASVLFEYRHLGTFTVFGRVTGIRYHFPGPGARVRVDARDAPVLEVIRGLEAVPQTS
jgi:hypothetical protein